MSNDLITPPDIREEMTTPRNQQMSASEYATFMARERTRVRERNRRIKALVRQGYNHREANVIYYFEEILRREEEGRRREEEERRRVEEELEYSLTNVVPRPINSPNDRAAGYIRNYYNKSKKKRKKKRKNKKSRKNKK